MKASATTPRFSIRALLAALPNFSFSAFFLLIWIFPSAFGKGMVRHAMYVMLLEFIIVHSSGLMGTAAISKKTITEKVKMFLGLGLFYSLFAGAFSFVYGSLWPIVTFWTLTLNKFIGFFFHPPGQRSKETLRQRWGISALFYLLGIFLTTLLPVPSLGITRHVIREQHFNSSGAWVSEPYRVVAFGFLYFLALGLYELLSPSTVESTAE